MSATDRTTRREAGDTTTYQRPCCVLSWTDERGPHRVTVEKVTLLGASSQTDVVVSDPTVSRLHAEIEPRPDGIWIRDLQSTNGTHVDGLLVGSARLPVLGSLKLGSVAIAIEPDAEPATVALHADASFGDLVGGSVAMRELYARMARVAPTDATVLIQGETGTGKELVARAIHSASSRSKQPFVVVDCGAIPEHLFESELFGHARGAFTGAVEARTGVIESANGGTLFLDEMGELPLSLQAKLLRVVESRTVRRVGETEFRKVDVRFISATHRDLVEMVAVERFREDLYFRLAVVPLVVPPLRFRRDDVPALLERFLPQISIADREALARGIASRPWSGNVRELKNFVDRAAALGIADALATLREERTMPELRPLHHGSPPPGDVFVLSYRDFRQWAEAEYVRRLSQKHHGDVNAMALSAGVDRTYVYRLIKKHLRSE